MHYDIYSLLHLQIFSGNTDNNSPVTIEFPEPITTKLLRIRPIAWYSWCSLRFEVLGCGKINIA